MSPVEIDPLTGAPVIKPITEIPPATTESTSATTSDETSEKETEEIPESSFPVTKEQFLAQVDDILKRYTSDTQSHSKAFEEIKSLVK